MPEPERAGRICRLDSRKSTEETKANSRRIVACVNACAGIPTGELESMDVASLIQRIRDQEHVLMTVHPWEWRMMPNGARGWVWDGYLTDQEMRQFCEAASFTIPEELEQ